MNCPPCESTDLIFSEKIFKNGTKHVEQRCAKCNRHMGYKAHVSDDDFKMPFGKYQGDSLADIIKKDPEYTEWLLTSEGNRSMKNRINNLITKLANEKDLTKTLGGH